MANFDSRYVEIDLPYCALSFGETNEFGTCTATGKPCYNSRNLFYDCQDKPNYTTSKFTVRFYQDTGVEFIGDGNLSDVPTFSLVDKISISSAVVNPAESIGERASGTITMFNSRALLNGIDKYLSQRDASNYDKGTFWGKFLARYPFIEGSEIRVYSGFRGRPHIVEHYVVDGVDGPKSDGRVSFKVVDFLRLADGKKSQFPKPSSGYLAADLNDTDLTCTLAPSGIGDAEYPLSGYVAIGNEAMPFTREGDVLTFGQREYRGKAAEHKQEDAVQVVGVFESESVATIINELVTNYTPMDSSYVPLAKWQTEVDDYISSLYSCFIVKPESVKKLLDELVQQAGLIFYADVQQKEISLRALRPLTSGQEFNRDNSRIAINRDLEQLRVSQVLVFYNQKDPFKQLSDESNYYSIIYDQTDENLYQSESIRKVFSRWIPSFGQSIAVTLKDRLLERYQHPPKEFTISQVRRDTEIFLGDVVNLGGVVENDEGDYISTPCFLTEVNRLKGSISCKAQQYRFTEFTGQGGGAHRVFDITTDRNSAGRSLRDIYDSQYSNLTGVLSVTFKIRPNTVTGTLTVGDFEGLTPTLIIEAGGYLVGAGGSAIYDSSQPATAGDRRNGGTAFIADYPIDIDNLGTIAGGGGAGGNGNYGYEDASLGYDFSLGQYGGAGAGITRGLGSGLFSKQGFDDIFGGLFNNLGQTLGGGGINGDPISGQDPASFNSSGRSSAGVGGGLAEDGLSGYESTGVTLFNPGTWRTTYGGLAGKAIEGNSNINWLATGTIIGAIE